MIYLILTTPKFQSLSNKKEEAIAMNLDLSHAGLNINLPTCTYAQVLVRIFATFNI